MKREEMSQLARLGAVVRLAQLKQQMADLIRSFPSLRGEIVDGRKAVVRRGRKRRSMSKAQRAAISARMKKFWREKRSA